MPGGPSQSEILQGDDGDCTTFAFLGSLAAIAPGDIQNMLHLAGHTSDGVDVYAVSLFSLVSAKPQIINVDARFLATTVGNGTFYHYDNLFVDPANGNIVLWPLLAQKALAVYFGGYELLPDSMASVTPIVTGKFALGILRPEGGVEDSGTPSVILSKYFGFKNPITVDSHVLVLNTANDGSTTPVTQQSVYNCASVANVIYCLVDSHEYEVLAFDGNDVTLRNPWGYNLGAPTSSNGILILPMAAYTALTTFTWTTGSLVAP